MARRPARPDEDEERGKSPDQQILDEAKFRFRRAQDWENGFRKLFIDDVKFDLGDSDNGWQWPDNVKEDRDVNNRPCLTVNKTKTIILRLANEAKRNAPEPRVKPVGEKVSFDAAQVWESLIRHIFYISNAPAIFGTAKVNQLEGGIGYWRVSHDFVDDRSFDQDIRLEPLDPMEVYLDCDIKTVDGADAMWGFIFTEYDRKEFNKLFPDIILPSSSSPGLDDKDDWIRKDGVRTAEYYRINLAEDELVYLEDESGETWTGLRSEMPDGSPWKQVLQDYEEGKSGKDCKVRKIQNRQLEWFKIAGNEIIERRDGTEGSKKLKGRYIPIVREVGRERRVENRLYRAGLVRALKDAQRIYNYNTSSEVESVALQTKTPWIVAAEAIEGNETAWNNANTTNAAYLTWRHTDEEGQPIPPPERLNPPAPAQGFLDGMRIAAAELEMASGIQQPQQQNPALERTPAAINERSRAGDITNYDFTDNEMQAMRHTAVIILDLAPHIYDTERIVKIRAKDGTVSEITIDPKAQEAYHEDKPEGADKEAIKVLFNPTIGKFAVEADVGPAYQTQREQTWQAFIELIKGSPELMNIMGDLGFLAADFPLAQEIAERLRRNIEQTMPWLLKDSQVGPLIQKLTEQNGELTKQLSEVMERLAVERLKLKGKDQMRDLDAYDSETRRITAEGSAAKGMVELDLTGGFRKLVLDTMAQAMGWSPDEIEKANKSVISQQSDNAGEAPSATTQ